VFQLLTLSHRYLAAAILQRFEVRIHSALVQKGRSWLRLWYLLRGFDVKASGYCQLPMADICQILQCGESTVRGWLREGEWAGAFRKYSERRGEVRVILSGLTKLTRLLGLTSWGAVTRIPIFELSSLGKLRAYATAAVTIRQQQLSRFAAIENLTAAERRRLRVPKPGDFFQSSDQVPSDVPQQVAKCGVLPCVLHVGPRRVFTSKGFIPYGASQRAIALAQNYGCTRTVYRHHELLGIPRRQLVQTKAAYSPIVKILADDSATGDRGYLSLGEGNDEVSVCSVKQHGERRSKLFEHNGRTSSERPSGALVTRSSFFKFWGRDWIYRPNIYQPVLKLDKLKAREHEFANGHTTKNSPRFGVVRVIQCASMEPEPVNEASLNSSIELFEISESGIKRLSPAG
jgi:hypothetical protein